MKEYKIVDLFAGIGGMRRGFELSGRVKVVGSAEIDHWACKTYKWLYGEDPLGDVSSEEFKGSLDSFDILLGGFSCQPFSIAGKGAGFEDKTRGTMFYHLADILSRYKPKGFLFENVEGLLRHNRGKTFSTVLEVLRELGYGVIGVNPDGSYRKGSILLNTKDFGLPQNRPRVYLMGFLDKEVHDLEFPKSDKVIYSSLSELLESKVDEKYYLAEGYWESLKEHRDRHASKGNNFGYVIVSDKGIANTILATGGSGKERNLIRDLSVDYSGKMVKGKKTPINSEGIRVMTPIEYGRLQGFISYGFMRGEVDEFSFPGGVSDTQKYKMFGNAVSIPVVETLARFMISELDLP